MSAATPLVWHNIQRTVGAVTLSPVTAGVASQDLTGSQLEGPEATLSLWQAIQRSSRLISMSLSTSFWQLVTAASSALSGLPTAIAGHTAMAGSSREQLGSPSTHTESLIDSMLDDQHLVLVFEMLGRRELLCRAACVSKRWCVPVPQCWRPGDRPLHAVTWRRAMVPAVDLRANTTSQGRHRSRG